jgi:hypothetical protein
MSVGLSLALPMAVSAQPEAGADEDMLVPQLDGLAWYRSHELTGAQMQETLPEQEVADWATLLDDVGATFDDIEYTYQRAFDPATLPDVGGVAVVRIAGADTDTLRDAVVADISLQLERAGYAAPTTEAGELAGKQVVIVAMPEDIGLDDAVVYASGDTAWAIALEPDLVEAALDQLP